MALTIARMPALTAIGNRGHASTTIAKSGESSDASVLDLCSSSASLVQTGVQTGELAFAGSVVAVFTIDDPLLRDEEVAGSNPVTPIHERSTHWC